MRIESVNFIVDTLSGCDWACRGCHVQDATMEFNDFDIIERVFSEAKVKNIPMSSFRIGPTDILAAKNGFSTLQNPKIKGLLQNPKTDLLMNTTLLGSSERIKHLITILNEEYEKDYIYFNVILNPKEILKESYRERIERQVNYIRNNCRHHVKFEPSINVEPDDEFLKMDLVPIYDFSSRVMPEIELELAINFARATGRDNQIVLKGLEVIKNLPILYSHLQRPFLISKVGCENHFINLLWRGGNWYWVPNLFFEFANVALPEMKIEFHDLDSMLESINQVYYRQYDLKNIECVDCEFNSLCMPRFLPAYMNVLKQEKCLLPKSQLKSQLQMWHDRCYGQPKEKLVL
jgi:hypothetical protein